MKDIFDFIYILPRARGSGMNSGFKNYPGIESPSKAHWTHFSGEKDKKLKKLAYLSKKKSYSKAASQKILAFFLQATLQFYRKESYLQEEQQANLTIDD